MARGWPTQLFSSYLSCVRRSKAQELSPSERTQCTLHSDAVFPGNKALWRQKSIVNTQQLSFNTNGHVVFFTRRNLGRRPNEPTERLASFDNIPLLHCFDNIPGWLLKENADLLAGAMNDILNASYREGCLPQAWREANVVPVPKQGPIRDVNKHLRPISLTPIISKVAEDYVVEEYIKPMSQRIWIPPRIWTPRSISASGFGPPPPPPQTFIM